MHRTVRLAACVGVVATMVVGCSVLPFGRCEVVITERVLPAPAGDRAGETLLVAGTKLNGIVVYEVRSPGHAARVAALAPEDLGGPVDRAWLEVEGSRPYVVSPTGRVLVFNPFTGRSSALAELGVLDEPSVGSGGGLLFVADRARLFQVSVPSGLPTVVTGLPGSATGPVVPLPGGGVATLVRQGEGTAVALVATGASAGARTVPLPAEDRWTSLSIGARGELLAGGPDRVAVVDVASASSLVTVPPHGADRASASGGTRLVDVPGEHLVAVGDQVWSGGPAGQVDRLDGDGRQRASATTVSCGDDQVPVPVAGAGSVWAAVDRDNVVGRIDPETGWLVARIAVPLPVSGEAAVYRVVGGDRTAWVLDEAGGGVHELDLERNVARVVPLPGPPDAVVDAAMIAMPGG
jgi:hypothetical protein